ncbi:GntR family transcriptional regulator [Tepidamorphus sp. 3E244]|uniref:GntR family transcriptional regulator n=1 Tax=Tepidamorphus sp. 3E244 TaxID=3385498 RepID=UPI0038FBED2C
MDSTANRPANPDAGQRQERAYHELKRRIMYGELAPGVRMLENDVAVLLDMSRTPVREAMIRLADEGLIEVRPRRGMEVLGITVDDLEEIYAVRLPLEAAAVELAATRGLEPEERTCLEEAQALMDQALSAGDTRTWSEADDAFHGGLVKASRNRRLATILDTLQVQLHRGRRATTVMREKPQQSNQEHHGILAAIIARDPERARSLHEAHLRRTSGLLVDLLRSRGMTSI